MIPIILLIFISIFIITNLQYIDITIASENSFEWSVTLNFDEPGGKNNNILFGEALDASDGQDSNDIPTPPPGIPSYIRPWFDSDLKEPYNSLFYDIKNYPDESKIWDLYVQWIPSDYASSTIITISWDISEILSNEYNYVVLYDYNNNVNVANMRIDSSYAFNSSATVEYHFQVICNTESTQTNNPPKADINSPQQSYINQSVTLDASGSNDSDGYIQYYRWDFTNDGEWDTDWITEAKIIYFYSSSGNYTIKLQVKDDDGATNTVTKKISILHLKEDEILPISKTNGPYSGIINQNITFDASGSYDVDGIITSYTWKFGDGTSSNEIITNHSYSIEGNYAITLLVVDDDGLIDIATTRAYIFNRDSDEDGWGDSEELDYGSDPFDSEDFPLDTDNDHIPDSIDENDDNDGLSDIIEEKIGSNPKNKSDVLGINVKGATHFLIDVDMDGKSELFYNSRSGNTTEIKYKDNNEFLIDEDGDGKWDYVYNPAYGTIVSYQKKEDSSFPFTTLILLIFICLILVIAVWFFIKKD
jgi:PKD repeat protein